MITSINHMSFTVSNVDASVRFYHELLGLEIVSVAERSPEFSARATGIPGAHLKIAYLKMGNCAVELVQYLSGQGKRIDTTTSNVGSAHICFTVSRFHGMVQRLREKGVRFVSEPAEIPAGPNKGRHMVYLKDPDGNTLEFIEVD